MQASCSVYLEYFIELWLIDIYYISIILKAGVEQLRWLWGVLAQWSKHLRLKKETRVDSQWLPFFSSWLPNVDGMKDLWPSTTVWLLSTQV